MSMIYALREALRVVLEEGLTARYKRHEHNACALLAGAEAIGLQPAAEEGVPARPCSPHYAFLKVLMMQPFGND